MRRAAALALLGLVACTGCATGLTGDPEAVSDHDARLAGQVVSNAGGPVEYWLDYGPTKAYGSQSPHQTIATVQNTPKPVTVTIAGLNRATSYHYRFCAQDSQQQGGPHCGDDLRFKTQSFACGETVTTDIRFTANMECRQVDPGLAIGAPGVDINLAGHRFTAFFSPEDEFDTRPRAIVDEGGYDDLTVRNGTLANWVSGVRVVGAARPRVLNLDMNLNFYFIQVPASIAVVFSKTQDSEIRHVHADFGGFAVGNSARAIIADSSTTRGSGGISIGSTDDSRVVRNTIDNGLPQALVALLVRGNHNHIADNRVSRFESGIWIQAGAGNVVADNELFDMYGDDSSSTVEFGDGDGIWVDLFTNQTVVRGNFSHDNRMDGIEVKGVGTQVTGNRAEDNRGWGIDVVSGVTDGGGNTASGNGEAAQCRNVFCGAAP
jgi:hypothetical protein